MQQLLPFIISGITTGAVYGLSSSGLVLTYKTSGIFNFGHGAIATAGAYCFYWMRVDLGWDWKLCFVVSVFVLGPVMGLVMEHIARRLSVQRLVHKVVGTVGLIVLVQGLASVKYGHQSRPFPPFLPKSDETFGLFGARVGYDQLTIAVVAVLSVAVLYFVFRHSRLGTEMRAVVDDGELLELHGTDPVRVRRVAWFAGCTFAALSGVLVAPIVGLDAVVLTFLVVQAFGAAAVGAFSSIPLAFLGGILTGVVADVSRKYVVDVGWLSGLPASIPFVLLFFVLLALPKRKLRPPTSVEKRPQLQYKGPPLLRVLTGAALLVPILLVPTFVDTELNFFTQALTGMVLILSLGLLVKTSGQVSLCHTAFMAIGACAFSQLSIGMGLPWLVALLLGGLVAVPVGALIAIPSIRLSGLFLALATFGFGIMVQNLAYQLSFMFGKSQAGRSMPRPSFATSDVEFYYVLVAFVVVTALVMVVIHEARLGRMLRGLSDAPLAISTLGLSTNVTRVTVFCISAFFAAVGGILYGASLHFSSWDDPTYGSFYSLVLVAMLVLAPFREPWYIIPGAVGIILPAYWTTGTSIDWLNAIFGLAAVAVSISGGHPVMSNKLRRVLTRIFTVRHRLSGPEVDTSSVASGRSSIDMATRGAGSDEGLVVRDLTVRFGGLVAVSGVSLQAPIGRITGLIGPNGAGKTTTFNVCSGLIRPTTGQVFLHGKDVSDLSAPARARLGLGRTFQRMQLCDALSVAENVSLGREASQAGGHWIRQLAATRAERRTTRAETYAALDLCGIADLAGMQAGELSTGQRRLVELARCLAGPFDVLLLDEPSSGLDHGETERFGDLLLTVQRERRCAILLVEHDVNLVMRVTSHIYVLDFGRLLFEGDPIAVASSSEVQAAYLGVRTNQTAAAFDPAPVTS